MGHFFRASQIMTDPHRNSSDLPGREPGPESRSLGLTWDCDASGGKPLSEDSRSVPGSVESGENLPASSGEQRADVSGPAAPGLASGPVVYLAATERGSSGPVPTAGEALVRDRFTWLLTSLAFLMLLSFFLPYTIERITYAITRGRELARYETAGDTLRNVALKDLSDAYQLVANRVGPSVVHVMVAARVAESAGNLPGFSRWHHPATSQGSGVIVDKEGYIVTNAHVIAGYGRIRVKLSDGQTVPATVVGVDRLTDMAVLKVSANGLIAAEWGDSDALDVGALVWALGSPLGLQHSVTFGILSGKNRSFSTENRGGILDGQGIAIDSPYHNFLQTDAAVNPGNSGGPLVDSQGRIVGINTAIVGEAYQGISFSIPSSVARPIYERIRAEGRVTRGWLGVDPQDITPELAQGLGLSTTEGALVVRVVPDLDGISSPAQEAGLLAGDVIIRWDGKPVKSRSDLFSLVALTPIGTTVHVGVLRKGAEQDLLVTVAERPGGME